MAYNARGGLPAPLPARFKALGLACGVLAAAQTVAGVVLAAAGLNRFFLLWNLFLAALPYGFARWMHHRARQGRHGAAQVVLGVLWLLFYPNAPYMLTDWLHLTTYRYFVPGEGFSGDVQAWLWFFQIFMAVAAGVLLGCMSLYCVHALCRRRFGGRVGWAFCVVVSALSGLAIYMGRVLRFNSWDALTRPLHLLRTVWGQLGPASVQLCLLYAAMALVPYVLFWLTLGGWGTAAAEAEGGGEDG